MDFLVSDDEEALAANVRRLCEARLPVERLRQLGGTVDREDWKLLGDAGAFSLRLPEDEGGAGLGMVHAVLVFEQLGRSLVPGPLTGTHLAAGLVDGAATGDSVVGVVELAGDAGPRSAVVEHLASLDELVLVDADGLFRVDPADLDAVALARPLDPLSPVHRVAVREGQARGTRVGSPEDAARWHGEGCMLTAALLLGGAGALTDKGVAYAKEREQFDRPVGSFQAVKHMLADMLVRYEVARAAVHAAAVTFDDPEVGDLRRAVAGAKLLAGDAALHNGKSCVQVHGGMGFTWEVDVHLYLKRALVLDTSFGSTEDQAEAVAQLV